jgi:hypothetical protein
MADITGMSVNGISKAVSRGELKLDDKKMLVRWLASHLLMEDVKQDSKSVSTEVSLLPEIIE